MELNVTIDELQEELLDRISIYFPKKKPRYYRLKEISENEPNPPPSIEGKDGYGSEIGTAYESWCKCGSEHEFNAENFDKWISTRLRAGEYSNGWTKIEDGCEMPDFDDPVLWLCENGNMHVEALDKDGNPWLFEAHDSDEWGDLGNKATHWRKLPVPPKQLLEEYKSKEQL